MNCSECSVCKKSELDAPGDFRRQPPRAELSLITTDLINGKLLPLFNFLLRPASTTTSALIGPGKQLLNRSQLENLCLFFQVNRSTVLAILSGNLTQVACRL